MVTMKISIYKCTLSEKVYGERFTSDEIRQFGQQYPDARVRYIFPNAAKMTPGYVLIYPSQKASHESIMRGIKNLEDGIKGSTMLPKQKLDLFRVLHDLETLEYLANSLKTSNPSQTPSMTDVVSSLQEMQGK